LPRLLHNILVLIKSDNFFVFHHSICAGASIYACQAIGRHVVALEEDQPIFEALLAPLIHTVSTQDPTPQGATVPPLVLDEEVVPIKWMEKTSRFSK